MKFRRMYTKNFRLLHELELDFSIDDDKPVTVIRAENETGKTTILSALQWVMFGDEGLPNEGVGYRISPIYWDASESEEVDIEVELEFEHTFEKPNKEGVWSSKKEVFLAHRKAIETVRGAEMPQRYNESFQLFQKDQSGYTPMKGGELVLRQILGSNLKDLFFTDGDRALSFITAEVPIGEKRKMVQKAIRDMLGFELLQNAQNHVRNSIKQIRAQVKEFSGAEELDDLQSKIAKLEESESSNEKRLSDIEEELKQTGADIEINDRKLERALEKGDKGDLIEKVKKKQAEIETNQLRLKKVKQEHSDLFRRESLGQFLLKQYIIGASKILEDLIEKGRIPRTAIPVLRERLDMGICICGESLKEGVGADKRRQNIKELITQQASSSDADQRLTTIRSTTSNRLITMTEEENKLVQEIKSVIERRDDLDSRITDLEKDLKELEIQISELPDADVGFLKSRRKDLLEIRERLIREQEILKGQSETLARGKRLAKEEWDKLTKKEKKCAQIQYRLTAADDILSVIALSYKEVEDNEIPRVCEDLNQYFMEMIEADPENAIIREAAITDAYDIAVYGPERRRLDTDLDLNGASRRALTLAFILAVTEASGVKAPNVIDTPLGMMSGIVKRSVFRVAASHTTQLILFLTRSEITGCEDLIDQYAGQVFTLSNSAHYPRQLVNSPGDSYHRVMRCECNHKQYCSLCERVGDRAMSQLVKRP